MFELNFIYTAQNHSKENPQTGVGVSGEDEPPRTQQSLGSSSSERESH